MSCPTKPNTSPAAAMGMLYHGLFGVRMCLAEALGVTTFVRKRRCAVSSSTPERLEGGLFTIVVGFDFSEVSSYALEQAARIARRIPTCELHVVHVAEPRDGGLSHEQLSRLRRYVQEKARTVGGWQEQRAGVHVRVGDVD